MMEPELPGDVLALEQWRLVDELSRSLDPMQARWLSGYFAGFDAALRSPPPQAASQFYSSERSLTILFGTETGNAAEVARTVEAAAIAQGRRSALTDMADYKVRQLALEQDLIIIVSTHGEGDPPQPAADFFEFVEGRKAPSLEGMRFAVLGLGDSTYEYYCEAGKRLDRRLEELGAVRLAQRVRWTVQRPEARGVGLATFAPVGGVPIGVE